MLSKMFRLCCKVLFIDPNIQVGLYIILVLFGSIFSDLIPIPESYFSMKRNLFNVYFVKLSWIWTMPLLGSFVGLTSYIYCCGDWVRIRKHLLRLFLATINWFLWTHLFDYVEHSYGYCDKGFKLIAGIGRITGRESCLSKGFTWNAFSISGHTFVLIYYSLIIMEEAKALIGWEAIKNHLKNEERKRNGLEGGPSVSPLHFLTNEQFAHVKNTYGKYTALIHTMFIVMTFLTVIWNVMLLATITYFHTTPEKFMGSVVAILIWFFTYHLGSLLPGDGTFRYMNRPVE